MAFFLQTCRFIPRKKVCQKQVSVAKTLTLPGTNCWPLKIDSWNTTFLLGRTIFRDYVKLREGRIWFYALGSIFGFLRLDGIFQNNMRWKKYHNMSFTWILNIFQIWYDEWSESWFTLVSDGWFGWKKIRQDVVAARLQATRGVSRSNHTVAHPSIASLASEHLQLVCPPWKFSGPQKERIVFQSSIFSDELLVLERVYPT